MNYLKLFSTSLVAAGVSTSAFAGVEATSDHVNTNAALDRRNLSGDLDPVNQSVGLIKSVSLMPCPLRPPPGGTCCLSI